MEVYQYNQVWFEYHQRNLSLNTSDYIILYRLRLVHWLRPTHAHTICLWVHEWVFCSYIKGQSTCPVSPLSSKRLTVKAGLMKWWMQRLCQPEMKGVMAPLEMGFTICSLRTASEARRFSDRDISETLEHLAWASNTFYPSHVALLIPFCGFLRSDHCTLSGSLREKSYTINILETLRCNGPQSTFMFYFEFD